MESRNTPPRTLSDLLALSEVEEDSLEDFDQRLDTAIDNNSEDTGDGATTGTNHEIVEILQSVEASTTVYTKLPLYENITAVPSRTASSPKLLNGSKKTDILIQEAPEFSLSSPIHPIPSHDNDGNVLRSSHSLSMSPTTLLNSLLSQSDIVLDEEHYDEHGKHSSSIQQVSSVSIDDTTFMNANMEISKSVEISNDDIDSSFLTDNKDAGSHLFCSGSDDDGMNSFVTAREDGDGNSTVHSKESTVVTALIDNKSGSDEIVRNIEYVEGNVELLQETPNVDSKNEAVATIDRQIIGSVSFRESTETKYETTSAPLWVDDDPSTPKRSGREFVLPPLPAQNNDTTIMEDSAATEHQNPNIDATIVNVNDAENGIADAMGNIGSTCTSEATLNEDKINLQGAVPQVDVLSPTVTTDILPINCLSIPNLSEVNISEDQKESSDNGEDNKRVVPSISEKGLIECGTVIFGSDEFESPDVLKSASNTDSTIGSNLEIANYATNEPTPDIIGASNRSLATHLDNELDPISSSEVVDAKAENVRTNSPFLSAENLSRICTDASNSNHMRTVGNELKSLHVEFPSTLNKSQKRSDVSLSSASSTISHGSFHKTHGGIASFGPAADNEQQHRRNASNDSLPPRSPMKGNALLENQKVPSSATTRHYPSSKDNDENDAEKVETKWMKQSLSIVFNPKRSIFADKHDATNRPSSLSPPGSPPEPYYSDSDGDDGDSFHEETRTTSSSGIKISSSPGLWDMMADCESIADKCLSDKYEYVHFEHDATYRNQDHFNDESIAESSVSPSEFGASKSIHIATKPSIKTDVSISSFVMKRPSVNKLLSISQHSKGSYSSARSSQGRKEKRVVLTPFGNRSSAYSHGRVELDASSLGRYSSYEVSSPERISMFAMHSSSPDLYKLNEESQSSHQASPVKQIEINTFVQTATEIYGEALITEAQPHDILSPESLVQQYSLLQENEELNRDDSAILLQEKLLEFSTICPLVLPLRSVELPSYVKYMGSLKWRQLVANWMHSEIFREMVSFTPKSPLVGNQCKDEEPKSAYSASSGRPNTCGNIELGNVPIRLKNRQSETTMLRQLDLQDKSVTISSFLTSIESGTFEAQNQKLRHLVSATGTDVAALPVDILYDAANEKVPFLRSFIRDIVAFASISNPSQTEYGSISYAIDVKNRIAIDRKANMKYGGDIFQVKDVLRSQITFRNDKELVCGLVRLLQKVKAPANTDVAEKIRLIRIKNLFSCNRYSAIPTSPLPTGYRHVLLNFRLPGGLIFELQLNLFPIFKILGQEGYSLHRSLCDMNDSMDKSDLNPKTNISLNINELIAEMVAYSSGKFHSESFFDKADLYRDDKSSAWVEEQCRHQTRDDLAVDEAKTDMTLINGFIDSGCDNVPCNQPLGGKPHSLDDLFGTATMGDLLLAMLQCGSNDISRNPRNFAAYWCIYELLSFVLKIENEETASNVRGEKPHIMHYAHQILLQCLTISNQSNLTGMTSWFEYGSSTAHDHFTGQPFSVLQKLAYDCAHEQKWKEAESLCRSLVICCEQHLPLHHPTTLSSLFDLSISSSMIGNQSFADKILNRAAERLSKYLFAMENLYTSHLSQARSCSKLGQAICRIEHGRDAIFELHAFASLFQRQLNRDMVSLIGIDNEVVVANRCLVADTLSVLANCNAAAHFFLGTTPDKSDGCGSPCWRMAYRHYELCYTSLAASKALDDPFVIRSLYGVARCLREFGETENALTLLSFIFSYRDSVEGKSNSDTSSRPPTFAVDESKEDNNGIADNHSSLIPRFLPIVALSKPGVNASGILKSMSAALCLWLMAILSVDTKIDDEGRERSFGYLHHASLLLQASLNDASEQSDDATRAMCIRFLSMIEDEAEQISEPMYE